MATLNRLVRWFTHEGAVAARVDALAQLERSVMSCLLWEDEFYEDGQSIGERIAGLVKQVPAEEVARVAVQAKRDMKLRHVPLLLARKSRLEMIITAGCVGLGFAAAENLIYFASAGPAAAFGRFLTANFLHTALSGLLVPIVTAPGQLRLLRARSTTAGRLRTTSAGDRPWPGASPPRAPRRTSA